MSSIRIYEPELLFRRGLNGFYRHFLSALVEHAGAQLTDKLRPLPRMLKPREHESCWIEWNGAPVFFDLSDHVQLFDLEALKLCSVYFKANLHRNLARRVFSENDLEHCEPKLAPFLFFPDGLKYFEKVARWRRFWRLDQPKYDVCCIMGIYQNLIRDGAISSFEHADESLTPASYHFWIRWHVLKALNQAGISGYYRLTSRGNELLEDGMNVFSNLNHREFSRRITDGRITVVCTLPHALFPWKAAESFVLGRPILIEQMPLTETPSPFMPKAGEHFLELIPDTGGFDPDAPLSDPSSYRVLKHIDPMLVLERAMWLREVLQDRRRLDAMAQACREFALSAYAPLTIVEYIYKEVEKRIS